MTLKEKVQNDLKEAMKSKDSLRLEVIRSIVTAIKNLEVEKMKQADDNDVIQAIQREVKKRKEAITMFRQAGREELAEKELAELAVLEEYLPKQLSEEEIREKVKQAIEVIRPSSVKDRGKIMGSLMKELKGKADGDLVGRILDEELNKLFE
ncbi:GatB/YqeY domain-containing protein [Coprothermobacteraceae bacterium]|nr:GatB/YqeY domain-containing protein [Coprothermobacteraceae bacterium]